MKIDTFYNSKVFSFFSFFTNLILLNICWIALCLPVITAGASTAALHECILLLRKRELNHVFKPFWTAFRKNFRQGTLLGLIAGFILVLTVIDLMIVLAYPGAMETWITVLLVLPFLLTAPSLCYIFPLQAKFENTVPATVFNAWKLSMIHPGTSVALLALQLVPVAVCLIWPNLLMTVVMLWTAFGGSGAVWISLGLLNWVFRQYQNS